VGVQQHDVDQGRQRVQRAGVVVDADGQDQPAPGRPHRLGEGAQERRRGAAMAGGEAGEVDDQPVDAVAPDLLGERGDERRPPLGVGHGPQRLRRRHAGGEGREHRRAVGARGQPVERALRRRLALDLGAPAGAAREDEDVADDGVEGAGVALQRGERVEVVRQERPARGRGRVGR
jgi:hypothetical protein